ncbi:MULTISPECIES: hypothetical protein [unclassified Flavobacterium]|uniref:hypothetical protein n=1 Tax=unclassified Flavobacterium TaxID=196869 RepID=UPI0010663E9E|nr:MULTISPECIES: hypothetical protein [unclassified Flavobacterium]TDX09081.1 hypothetical protein EDB96_3999 [Flavobacterium sp. S87F.05.LMB.W.Kidney.N]BDU23801.1 hypothetical protein FLGSB24_05450 [Flavobacterium sp. GSB-24]
MKKLISIIICITLFSCNNSENSSNEEKALLDKISQLENENKSLKDSLSKNERDFLNSQMLIGVPDVETIKVGKKNNIVMLFHTSDKKLPKYEIYKIEGDKKIKIGENNQTKFNYNFIPKSIDDNKIHLLVKIPYQGKTIILQNAMSFNVKK